MEKSVIVTIERTDDLIIVSNNLGRTWEFKIKESIGTDHSIFAAIADIAGAMLTSTITYHLENLSINKIKYTLKVSY